MSAERAVGCSAVSDGTSAPCGTAAEHYLPRRAGDAELRPRDREAHGPERLSGPAGVTLGFGHDGHLLTDVIWSCAIRGTVHKGSQGGLWSLH